MTLSTRLLVALAAVAALAVSSPAPGDAYRPLGSSHPEDYDPAARWHSSLIGRLAEASKGAERSPVIAYPGMLPGSVSQLSAMVMEKHPRSVPSSVRARELIRRLSTHPNGLNVLNGYNAEVAFEQRNSAAGWRLVGKSNASQHDFYRPRPGGGPPTNAQVKFHEYGGRYPSLYAQDMIRDYRADKFAVPDDHVEPLKDHLRRTYETLSTRGRSIEAKAAARNLGRVMGIGESSKNILMRRQIAVRFCASERTATYVSFGAAMTLALGPTLLGLADGSLTPHNASYRAVRSLSLIGVGLGTEAVLASAGKGLLRGSVRGNLVVGSAVMCAETAWLLHEYGMRQALSNPEFYQSIGGSVAGLATGILAYGAVSSLLPGVGWVGTGVALLSSAAIGTVGYIGGKAATQVILETLDPTSLQARQFERLSEVRQTLDLRTAELQRLP